MARSFIGQLGSSGSGKKKVVQQSEAEDSPTVKGTKEEQSYKRKRVSKVTAAGSPTGYIVVTT